MKKPLFFLFFLWITSLNALDSIGTVIALDGEAIAKTEQADRPLNIDSPIYVGDTISVGSNSRVQIRYTDGGLLNLISNTEYKIKAYQYKKLFKKDHYLGELIKGGFRSLSGSIAKKNPAEYEVETPTSTLGLRGTIVEARVVGGAVYFGVISGLAEITNSAGSRLIGPSERAQFAVVYASNQMPEYLNARPQPLDLRNFAEPVQGLSIDAIQQSRAPKQTGTAPSTKAPAGSQPPPTTQSQPPATRAPAPPPTQESDKQAAPKKSGGRQQGGRQSAGRQQRSGRQPGGRQSSTRQNQAGPKSGNAPSKGPTIRGQEGENWEYKGGGSSSGSGGGGASVGGGC